MMAGLRDVDEHGHARGPEDARAKKLRENQEQRVLRGEMREQMNEATGAPLAALPDSLRSRVIG